MISNLAFLFTQLPASIRSFSSLVEFSVQSDAIGVAMFNNPDKLNAMTEEMGKSFADLIGSSKMEGLSALVFVNNCPNSFIFN